MKETQTVVYLSSNVILKNLPGNDAALNRVADRCDRCSELNGGCEGCGKYKECQEYWDERIATKSSRHSLGGAALNRVQNKLNRILINRMLITHNEEC